MVELVAAVEGMELGLMLGAVQCLVLRVVGAVVAFQLEMPRVREQMVVPQRA